MDLQPHILASSGSFAVAFIALFFSIIQLWLYCIRREEQWHLWGMLISLATLIYSIGVFIQYHAPAGELNHFTEKLQFSAIILLIHFACGFTCSSLGIHVRRNNHLQAALLHGLFLVLLWNTRLMVTDTFIYRDFLLLNAPYIEPRLGFLGNLFLLYVTAAISGIMVILVIFARRRNLSNASLYMAGFVFWILLGLHDAGVTFFNIKSFIFLTEYGFLGFSVSVIMVIMKNYIDLSSSAQKRATNLALEKDRYEAISQVIFDFAFAFRVEADGRLVTDWVAGPIELITGYTAEELSDIRVRRELFVIPEDRPIVRTHTRRLLEGKSETIEFRIRTKTGQIRWMRDHGRAMFDSTRNRITYIYGAMQDITERRMAEEALRENEKKYRLLVENANDAIFIFQDERIIFPNPRTLEMTGYDENELAEIPIGRLVHPDDRKMVMRNYFRRLRDRKAPHTYAIRIITRQDQLRNVQINAVRIDWNGKPATLNFVRDITTIKKLEDQLQKKKKLEAIGILAGGLSHDINNALTGILGNLELINYKFHHGLLNEEAINTHLTPIMSSIDRVTEQCGKLLAYARGGKYLPQSVFLNEIIREVLDSLNPSIHPRIAFTEDLDETLPAVRADSGQMRMMLDAVLQNAVESINGAGQVLIRATTAVVDGAGSEIRHGRYVEIIIEDTGVGMDEETRSKIFDPFFTTKFHGRGMSLAAVYGILKNHRGGIRVESIPGKGTTVRILMPCEPVIAEKSGDPSSDSETIQISVTG